MSDGLYEAMNGGYFSLKNHDNSEEEKNKFSGLDKKIEDSIDLNNF